VSAVPERPNSCSDGGVPKNSVRLTHCIFQEDWWLDAVAPGTWAVALVGHGHDTQARLPYVLTKKPLYRHIRQPHLTQTLGPWFRPTAEKLSSKLRREHQLAEELIAQLPRCDFFSMNFHYAITNWLPYHWMEFEIVPKVTYVLEKLGTREELWAGLASNIRQEIRKAEKLVEVVRSDDLDLFIDMNRRVFRRQRMDIPYAPEVLRRVDEVCAARGARHIYFARDEQQRVHAAIYIVHDDRCAYYLLGGGDPQLRTSGATSLLMWNAMLDAAKTSVQFNFEGSVIAGIERFVRAFGGEQKTYMNVRRANAKATIALMLRDAYKAVRRT
jgi:hypothetical protein